MRFFNLDLHIAVIGDIRQILTSQGHEVTDWTLAGNPWVLGRKRDKVDVVNETTWRGLNPTMCDAFYARYKTELEPYDAFIVTHTPSFAMLYERWDKPVICVASTRYEAPFTNNRDAWQHFNDYLRSKIDAGKLIPIANNKYDAAYAEHFTQRRWRVIPSLCNYTNTSYTGTRRESLYVSKYRLPRSVPGLIDKSEQFKRNLLQRVALRLGVESPRLGYRWQELAEFRSAVVIPYNASIMSIFEMYAAGMPMLFPTQRLARELYSRHRREGVFSELSYNQIRRLPSGSVLPCNEPDPNNYEDVDEVMSRVALSDFYDEENLAHLLYFDSFEELEEDLATSDWSEIHDRISDHHKLRTRRASVAWAEVVDSIAESNESSRTSLHAIRASMV